jgi:hypothetical protein
MRVYQATGIIPSGPWAEEVGIFSLSDGMDEIVAQSDEEGWGQVGMQDSPRHGAIVGYDWHHRHSARMFRSQYLLPQIGEVVGEGAASLANPTVTEEWARSRVSLEESSQSGEMPWTGLNVPSIPASLRDPEESNGNSEAFTARTMREMIASLIQPLESASAYQAAEHGPLEQSELVDQSARGVIDLRSIFLCDGLEPVEAYQILFEAQLAARRQSIPEVTRRLEIARSNALGRLSRHEVQTFIQLNWNELSLPMQRIHLDAIEEANDAGEASTASSFSEGELGDETLYGGETELININHKLGPWRSRSDGWDAVRESVLEAFLEPCDYTPTELLSKLVSHYWMQMVSVGDRPDGDTGASSWRFKYSYVVK